MHATFKAGLVGKMGIYGSLQGPAYSSSIMRKHRFRHSELVLMQADATSPQTWLYKFAQSCISSSLMSLLFLVLGLMFQIANCKSHVCV